MITPVLGGYTYWLDEEYVSHVLPMFLLSVFFPTPNSVSLLKTIFEYFLAIDSGLSSCTITNINFNGKKNYYNRKII